MKKEAGSGAEHAEEIVRFILKLASDIERVTDKVAVNAIVTQLKALERREKHETASYIPEVLERIDPDRYHSETKLIETRARKRLNQALTEYSKRRVYK